MTKNIETPWGEIGLITFKRTYARQLKNGGTEEFEDTVERELQALDKQLKLKLTAEEQEFYRYMRLSLKGSVAGRFMWQLGTRTVDKLGLASLQNCSFTVVDDPVRPFTWAMDMLMLGSGVGYSIKKEHVYNLPKLKGKIKIERFDDKSADFIVPDTREGWIKLLGKTLKAHFYSGQGFTYSTQLIRGKGAPISGFGGTASGPEDLCWGIEEISNILNNRSHKKLRPIDCLDIMNIIGRIVVAGNVRRSAQLAIGDSDDIEYLKAKRWDLGHIPNWRNMSNNSVDCENIEELPTEFWDTYEQGEPYGLVNLRLSRLVGRLGETQYADESVMGYNPSLRAGTKVWTIDGIKPIEELQDKEFLVRNLNGDIVKASCWLSKPKAQLYKIKLSGGHEYYCTAEHKWPIFTPQGWVKAETTELIPGHLLPINKFNTISVGKLGSREDGFFIGWLYGDGGIHIRKDNNRPQLNLIVSKKDDESNVSETLLNKLNSLKSETSNWAERKGNKELSCSANSVFEWLDVFGVDYSCKKLPSKIWGECSEEFIRGFVDGLFSSDGTVESSYKSAKIMLSSSKTELIKEVSELLGFYGIKHGTHHIDSKLKDKVFDRYTLSISSRENIEHFKAIFSLTVKHKQRNLDSISKTDIKPLWGSVYKIESIELTDIEEPVWDINVKDDTHCFQLSHVITGNCAEQSLADKETCCLAEIYLPNITSEKEMWDVAKMLYRVNKHSLALPCHLKDTEEIVHRNMRMGIGITGVMMSTPEQLSWLDITYRKLRAYDEEYSKAMGWNPSIKLTTVKPSGSLSLLAGVTPGVHPSPAGPYYIRRIRMAADSNLVDVCRANGYPVEFQRNFDGTVDKSTVVVSFPCKIPEWVKVGKDVDVIDQLEMVKYMQTAWSDNSVSVTAYYKKEDIARIKEYLKENWRDSFKTLSFLLYYGHGFDQAPYEEITKELYEDMVSKTTKITSFNVSEDDISEKEIGCVGGHCPIK